MRYEVITARQGQPYTYTQLTTLQACQDARGHSQKAARLRLFREKCLERNNDELYEVYRLLLPQVRCLCCGRFVITCLLCMGVSSSRVYGRSVTTKEATMR